MPPVQNGTVQKKEGGVMSSFMCCTTERSGQTQTYSRTTTHQSASYSSREQHNQSKYLWLDPTRWVEKRTVKKEKVDDETAPPPMLGGKD